ncbi:MAG: HAD family hydrolase [Deltaproteobacteria bacterium]|nr:HAD family hydrolase [Deltaproteobacteria bacterium]
MIRTVIFDVDGVLLESTEFRDRAFVYIFRSIGCRDENRILEIHRKHYGLYRKKKIILIYEDFFQETPSQTLVDKLHARFTDWILKRVFNCPFVPGAIEFLECKGDLPCYIVSAIPEDELGIIVRYHKLDKYFDGIFGSPTRKKAGIESILDENGFLPQEALFIGDRISDFRAAMETGIHFVGRVPEGAENPFPPQVAILKDLSALVDYLNLSLSAI